MKTNYKMKKVLKSIPPLLLSLALITEPAAEALVTYAAEPVMERETVYENTDDGLFTDGASNGAAAPDNTEDSGSRTDDNTGDDNDTAAGGASDNNADSAAADGADDASEDNPDNADGTSDNNPDNAGAEPDNNEDNPDDASDDPDAVEDSVGGGSDAEDSPVNNDEENTVDDAEDDSADDKAAAADYAMPDGYVLSPEQKEDKAALAASLKTFDESEEGASYVEREILALVDTQKEAETIAQAYKAELLRYDLGVATMKLREGASVADALYAAAELDNNLPAVYPNYYVYISSEPEPGQQPEARPEPGQQPEAQPESEPQSETGAEDERLEIEESEYDTDGAEVTKAPDDEELTLSETYEQAVSASAYGDPYLSYNSDCYQYQHVSVGSVYAWNAGYTGAGVKVAVLDTGGTAVAGELEYVARYDVVSSGSTSADDNQGHGSHVAGIIGARTNSSGGAGIAPDAQLYSIKVMGDNGTGTDADIVRGINKAVECNVDLINMSLGGLGYNAACQSAVDKAYNAGIAVFAAAGNDGGSNVDYPAGYKHVICIAAVDSNNQRAYFSNYGSWVDLSAPGVDIYSTKNDGSGVYVSKSGTSMACPAAVGEAAVILSAKHASIQGKTGGKKVDALESLMKSNTVSASGSGMGKGVTSLVKALKLNTAYSKPKTPAITLELSKDEQTVRVTIEKDPEVTVYYTTNGKAPSYKNGILSSNTYKYTGTIFISNAKKGTIQAIAVNSSGVSSSVKKVAFSIKRLVTLINISGVSNVAKGKSISLSAEVVPDYAANKKLTWKITKPDGSEPAGVSISQSGKVTAAKTAVSGEYIVTAAAKDASGTTGTYKINVIDSPVITSVKFKNTKLELYSDEGAYKMNDILDGLKKDNSKISAADCYWSSSKTDVALVSEAEPGVFVVVPKANGTAKITAIANDSSGIKAVCTITVKRHVSSISITGSGQIAKGKKITLKAAVSPVSASNKKVKWTIKLAGEETADKQDATSVNGVSVNGSGTVSASSKAVEGSYIVTATAVDGSKKTGSKTITVKGGKITSVTLDKKSASIFRTGNQYGASTSAVFTATFKGDGDYADEAYSITNSNPGIAKVSVSGSGSILTLTVKATGKAAGKTKITIAATDGSNKKASCTVSVTNPVSKINITPAAGSTNYVAQGKTLKLKAGLESEFGAIANKKIKWSIENGDSSLVKVNGSGKITVNKKATVGKKYKVSAEMADGSGLETYEITITQSGGKITLYNGFFPMKSSGRYIGLKGGVYKFPIYSSKSIVYGGYSVTSSNPKAISATISGGYVYLGFYNKGSATITVKANDGSGMQVKYKFVCK